MTLEHFLSISVPRAPPPQHGMLSSLALPPQVVRPKKITPGSAWRGARHRTSAPEMSTIVRAGEGTGRGLRGTRGRRKWGVESTSGDLRSPPALGGARSPPPPPAPPHRMLGRGTHSSLLPSSSPAFDCGEQRVAEQINFLHTSLCAAPRPQGPRPRPRPAPTT